MTNELNTQLSDRDAETKDSPSRRLSLFAEGGYNKASGDRRAYACFADLTVIVIIFILEAFAAVFLWFEGAFDDPYYNFIESIWVVLVPLITVLLYLYLFHAIGGRTPGKWFMGIRVAGPKGNWPGFGRAFLRLLGYMLTAALLLIPFLVAVATSGRALHDYLSGTRVIEVREKVPAWRYAFLVLLWGLFIWNISAFLLREYQETYTNEIVDLVEARQMKVSSALYYYRIDNKTYPPSVPAGDIVVSATVPGYLPLQLTTPVAYLPELSVDPFQRGHRDPSRPETYTYRYITSGTSFYVLVSNGPDGDADFNLADMISSTSPEIFFSRQLTHYGGRYAEYDPTNGTKSSGDIYEIGQ